MNLNIVKKIFFFCLFLSVFSFGCAKYTSNDELKSKLQKEANKNDEIVDQDSRLPDKNDEDVYVSVCGNGKIEADEVCDDGANNGTYGHCKSDCSGIGERCGDGIVNGNEVCDDGNTSDGDYCSKDCSKITGRCGDGKLQQNEVCDDGNTSADDYCSMDCSKITGRCGDGKKQINEACDDGNTVDGDYCSKDCLKITGNCGDGEKQINEACDDGANNGNYGYCKSDCSGIGEHCGDGIKNGPEACDDGNTVDGDYCSKDCSQSFECIGHQIRKTYCSSDVGKVQRQKCDTNQKWVNYDDCYESLPSMQEKCYDNNKIISCPFKNMDFFGQDAQYLHSSRNFVIASSNGDETIKDSMTDLIWQKNINTSTMTQTDAKNYCDNLTYASKNDWRLPTIREIETLLIFKENNNNVFIDSSKFNEVANLQIGEFWSTTEFKGNANFFWYIDLALGHIATYKGTESLNVMCVRGNFYNSPSFVKDDKIVTSSDGLVWQANKIVDAKKTWKEALAYCKNLVYAGKNDWRLPTVHELFTLVDYAKFNPAINFSNFDQPNDASFWTSTTYVKDVSKAVFIAFYEGHVLNEDKGSYNFVRCVR